MQATRQSLRNGTTLNQAGAAFPTLNFIYSPDLVSESQAAPIIANELGAIGMKVNLVSMTFSQYTAYLFSTGANGTNGFGIGYYSEDYFASQDYVTALANSNYTGAPGTFLQSIHLCFECCRRDGQRHVAASLQQRDHNDAQFLQ